MRKNIIQRIVIISMIATLFGCSNPKPQVDDGPGMVYHDADYRTKYANILDFDTYEGQPHFAVAFLGYGDRMEFRNAYVEEMFASLGADAIGEVQHIAYEGDEWYFIVPRYKDPVYIKDLTTGEICTVYQGEAFTVKCNLSDLHSNIEISTERNLGGYQFSPQMGGDGRLTTNTDIYDITDYSVLDEN